MRRLWQSRKNPDSARPIIHEILATLRDEPTACGLFLVIQRICRANAAIYNPFFSQLTSLCDGAHFFSR